MRTRQLPDATLSQDYGLTFEARGGSGEGYVWSLDGGSLPRGLTLGENGALSGVPLEGGDFDIDVAVSDSDGATGRASFTLHVRQSRWLVYWNFPPSVEVAPRLYGIDLASEGLQRTLISRNIPAEHNGADPSLITFSPDGRFLLSLPAMRLVAECSAR